MEIDQAGAILGIVFTSVVILGAILLGPSLFSSYQNWRIKRSHDE